MLESLNVVHMVGIRLWYLKKSTKA